MATTEGKGVSRKDFLKLLGAGAVVIAFGGIAGFMPSRKNPGVPNNGSALLPQEAFAQTSGGTWSIGGNTHAAAIHVAMLYNGKILYVAGSGYFNANKLGPFQAGIFDPVTNTHTALPNESKDMFCCGHAMLSNGNILLAGGTLKYDDSSPNGLWLGPKWAWIYDVAAGSFRAVQDMKHGRWYPTLVTLADGKVLTVNGYDEYGSTNRLIEIFDPSSETWSIKYDPQSTFSYCAGEGQDPAIMPGAGTQCYGPGVGPNALLYPRMHLMPEGLVVVCGQSKTMRTYEPATGIWRFAGNMLFNASRGYGSSVLLPMQNVASETGEVLIFGGTATADSFGTTAAEILTLNGTSIVSRWTNPSKRGRKHPIPVILPTGKIMVVGGTEFQNDNSLRIMEAEIFDPVTETWTLLPAMSVPRLYHSSGLLLPDGRVWTAGTTYTRDSRELRTEYYTPAYYSVVRPTISGQPVVGGYGGSIVIPTPAPQEIDAVSLVRLGTETHAYNCDQRLIWLQITNRGLVDITVQAPVNANIAPPGYYMIHVLKQGIPSVAKIIKVPGSGPSDSGYVKIYSVVPTSSYGDLSTGIASRVGEIVTASSSLIGENIKRVSIILKESGNPTGTISVVVRRGSDNTVALTFGTISASSLTTSDQTFTLTASTSHVFQANDKVLVEWAGTGSSTDKVLVKRKGDSDGFGGTSAYYVAYLSSYLTSTTRDLAGDWYKASGGSPPDTTLPNVAITSPTNGSTVSGPSSGVPIPVAGTSSDSQSGIQKVEVKLGSSSAWSQATPVSPGNWSTWTSTLIATSSGANTIQARATDNAGNTRIVTNNITVSFTSTYVTIYSVAASNNYSELASSNNKRVGEELTSKSSLIGQSVKRVSVILKDSGNPTGTISVVVRRGSNDSVALTFGTISASSLTTSDQTFTLTAPTSHVFQANDKVLVEWGGTGNSNDKVLVKRRNSNGFDGPNARLVFYENGYDNASKRDLAGTWYRQG